MIGYHYYSCEPHMSKGDRVVREWRSIRETFATCNEGATCHTLGNTWPKKIILKLVSSKHTARNQGPHTYKHREEKKSKQ